MNILLTGCFGFIGSNLCSYLLNKNHKVIGIDNLSNPSILPTERIKKISGENWKNFSFLKGDILDLDFLKNAAINKKIDLIIHLAAIGSVPRSFKEPDIYITNNELGFYNIILLSSLFNIKRICFASSSSVYGDSVENIKAEGAEGSVTSPYALSKKHNESLARILLSKLPISYTGLRFFNVFGPGQRFDSAYSAVIPKFINEDLISINGDGKTVRDFTFVDDVSKVIDLVINNPDKNEVFNVGKGYGHTLNELARLVDPKKEVVFKKARLGDSPFSIASVQKLKETYSYSPDTDMIEAIGITKNFYKSLGVL